jgi:Immunoglobulin-like domain of bacterial spore germination
MSAFRPLSAIVAVALVLTGCAQAGSPSNTVTQTTLVVPSTTAPSVTTTSQSSAPTTTSQPSAPTSTTSRPVGLEQPAIWPAAGVVFNKPEDAAADFVTKVLGVPPALGEFQQGDSRSGEIEVLSRGEGGSARIVRSLLLMRQLGPNNGWFILAATNENMTISSPEARAEVPARALTVAGRARGFEATVLVSALTAGASSAPLDSEVTMGGAMETPEPFSVSLDLSKAQPGSTVTILVRGDTGLETDPGEFTAIAVVIAT